MTTLFLVPVAARVFTQTFAAGTGAALTVEWLQILSPFSAAFNLPLELTDHSNAGQANIFIFLGFVVFAIAYNLALLVGMMELFKIRWRVSE
jgi:hypothetical protein